MAIKKLMSNNFKLRAITAFFLTLGLWTLFFYYPPIVCSVLLFFMMCIMITELKNMISNASIFLLLLPVYPVIPCMILIYFNQTSEYRLLIYYIFGLVFSFDSASYVCGKICSKFWTTYKIIPSISPKKSWEGACGGYNITTLILLTIMKLQGKTLHWQIFALSAIICSVAFAGDIFESYLKRSANIKDSGTMLPGHGGFLDRFDALLFVSYFFFIFKDYLLAVLK